MVDDLSCWWSSLYSDNVWRCPCTAVRRNPDNFPQDTFILGLLLPIVADWTFFLSILAYRIHLPSYTQKYPNSSDTMVLIWISRTMNDVWISSAASVAYAWECCNYTISVASWPILSTVDTTQMWKKVKVIHLIYILPISEGTSLQRHSGMARVVEGFHSFTCTPTSLSTNGMNHTRLCLSSLNCRTSFTDPGRIESLIGLGTTTMSKQSARTATWRVSQLLTAQTATHRWATRARQLTASNRWPLGPRAATLTTESAKTTCLNVSSLM